MHLWNMDLYIIKMKASGIMGCDHMCFKLVKILHFVDIIQTTNATPIGIGQDPWKTKQNKNLNFPLFMGNMFQY